MVFPELSWAKDTRNPAHHNPRGMLRSQAAPEDTLFRACKLSHQARQATVEAGVSGAWKGTDRPPRESHHLARATWKSGPHALPSGFSERTWKFGEHLQT